MFDADGYPTEETLEAIRSAAGPNEALDLARAAWHWPKMVSEELSAAELELVSPSYSPGGRYVRFATGGWSGNESVISALKTNIMGAFSWRLSASGGLHIFKYLEIPEDDSAE